MNWTVEEYNTVFEDLKSGNLVVDNTEISDKHVFVGSHHIRKLIDDKY